MTETVLDVKKSTRDGFGDGMLELAEKNKDVIALSANLAESTRLNKLIDKFPERYIECGVSEQNMAGVAAGLALSGKIPFITSFAAFSPGENWEQIRISICYNEANVKIASTHAGLSVGADGAAHQSLEDIAIMRAIPNLVVICPADYNEARKAVHATAKHIGPVYLRLGREPIPAITDEKSSFTIGKCDILKEGKDVTIIATGLMVYEAMAAAQQLENLSVSAEVINCHTIKPIDSETILQSVKKTKKVITAEEHQIIGGLGGAVAELLSEKHPAPIQRVGIKDSFGESGTAHELLDKFGCNSKTIIKAVDRLVNF